MSEALIQFYKKMRLTKMNTLEAFCTLILKEYLLIDWYLSLHYPI